MPFPVILIQLAIAIALSVASFLLAPRPKGPKPPEVKDLESPTAESGRPIPVTFGTTLIESPNILWYGDKSTDKEDL